MKKHILVMALSIPVTLCAQQVGHEEVEIIEPDPKSQIDIETKPNQVKIQPELQLYPGRLSSDLDGYLYLNEDVLQVRAGIPINLNVEQHAFATFYSADSLIMRDIKFDLTPTEMAHDFERLIKAEIDYNEIVRTKEKEAYHDQVLLSIDRSFLRIPEASIHYNGRKRTVAAFQMGRYEVTKEQYRLFAQTSYTDKDDEKVQSMVIVPRSRSTAREISKHQIDWSYDQAGLEDDANAELDHPAVFVSWDEAKAFCDWMSEHDIQYDYRLPFAYEWDYVASDGFRNSYPWDNEVYDEAISEHANLADISRNAFFDSEPNSEVHKAEAWNDGDPLLCKVGKRKPNAMGMYDMAGNAAEWVENNARYREGSKLIRGGSYFTNQSAATVRRTDQTYSYYPKDRRHHAIGFRMVRVLK